MCDRGKFLKLYVYGLPKHVHKIMCLRVLRDMLVSGGRALLQARGVTGGAETRFSIKRCHV